MYKILNDLKLDFDDVLICPKRSTLSSRSEVDLIRDFHFKYSPRKLSASPVIIANMDTTGTFAMSKALTGHGAIIALHKHYKIDQLVDFFSNTDKSIAEKTFYSLGTSSKDIEKMQQVFNTLNQAHITLPNVCVDVANGYSEKFVKTLSNIRHLYPESIIMAGNVVTGEMVEELILHGGVDIVKVGIGPGAVCTTRLKTGVGYGQISACLECADAAHGLGGLICADGGCKHPGDVCKALGTGADFVMLGSMFAGTDECEGEWEYEFWAESGFWQAFDPGYVTEKKKKSLKFYGMSSKEAMDKHSGGVAEYRTSEGRCVKVSYKGPAKEILLDILGGIRSACTYIGAKKIKHFNRRTTFIRVNNTHTKTYEKY